MNPVYLLDTNILSEPTKPRPNETVLRRLDRDGMRCAMAAITYHELHYGIQLVQSQEKRLWLERYLFNVVKPAIPVVAYDENAAEVHSVVRNRLKTHGTPVPDLDAQIASIAIANNLILVTRNIKDYEFVAAVSTLMLENWFE